MSDIKNEKIKIINFQNSEFRSNDSGIISIHEVFSDLPADF